MRTIDLASLEILKAVADEGGITKAGVAGGNQVAVYPLTAQLSRTRTMLVWRTGHRSIALDALRHELDRGDAKRNGRRSRSL